MSFSYHYVKNSRSHFSGRSSHHEVRAGAAGIGTSLETAHKMAVHTADESIRSSTSAGQISHFFEHSEPAMGSMMAKLFLPSYRLDHTPIHKNSLYYTSSFIRIWSKLYIRKDVNHHQFLQQIDDRFEKIF